MRNNRDLFTENNAITGAEPSMRSVLINTAGPMLITAWVGGSVYMESWKIWYFYDVPYPVRNQPPLEYGKLTHYLILLFTGRFTPKISHILKAFRLLKLGIFISIPPQI